MTRSVRCSAALAFACLGLLSAAAHAGPLLPPAGPVESTYKTLDEVEPRIAINEVNTPGDADSRYVITSRGSYYLTSDLPIIGVMNGIKIAADNVTIDLMGFTLYSSNPLPPGSPPVSINGIWGTGAQRRNICIRNGNVVGFGEDGIALFGDNYRLENLRVSDCVGGGIVTSVHNSVISDCSAIDNGGIGIRANMNSVVSNCVSQGNSGDGFYGGWIVNFDNCSSHNNGGDGFYTGRSSVLRGCVTKDNTGDGFSVGWGSVVTECTALGNARGVLARDETPSPGTCTTISGCSIFQNNTAGIEVNRQCLVLNNMCRTASIVVTGDGNRIEGNHVTSTNIGINVTGEHNLIIRNSVTFCTTADFSIVANNRYGSIIDITASGTAPVLGSSAASNVGTTDPWANFSH